MATQKTNKKINPIVKVLIPVMIVALLAIFGTTALPFFPLSFVNTTQADIVDIELSENAPITESGYLVTGQLMTHSVNIKNVGADCYIRIKATYDVTTPLFETSWALPKSECPIDDDWVYADDGYIYYKKPLSDGEYLFTENSRLPVFECVDPGDNGVGSVWQPVIDIDPYNDENAPKWVQEAYRVDPSVFPTKDKDDETTEGDDSEETEGTETDTDTEIATQSEDDEQQPSEGEDGDNGDDTDPDLPVEDDGLVPVFIYNNGAGGDIVSTIVVEAIQCAEFNPKWDAASPWGLVEVQESLYTQSKTTLAAQQGKRG